MEKYPGRVLAAPVAGIKSKELPASGPWHQTHGCGRLLSSGGLWTLLAALTLIIATAAARAQSGVPENYILAPTDRLLVTVFQEPDLTTDARVSNDGTILVPLIGSVRVAGGSVQDAAQAIRQKLKKGYLVNPQVTISVTEFSKRRFTVMGQVQHGGTFTLPDERTLDLLQAIGMAGGYTKIANPGKVTVQRYSSGKPSTFKLNAKAMAQGKDKHFEILPGDVITVDESIF